MLLEQPASLNKYVDPTIPLTWSKRWEILKPPLPLLGACALLMVEMTAFRLWLRDESLLAHWQLLAAIPAALLGIFAVGIELSLRSSHRSKRRLKLEPRRLTTNCGPLAWKSVHGWLLEPVAGEPNLRKITVEYTWKKKVHRGWSIVLQHPDQCQTLRSELEFLRQTGKTTTTLTELSNPMPSAKRRRVRGMVRLALAYYLFIHGAPMLVAGLTAGDKPRHHDEDSRFSLQEREKLGHLLTEHFSSTKEIRTFFVVTGATLTGLSLGLYFWTVQARRNQDEAALAGPFPASNDRDS